MNFGIGRNRLYGAGSLIWTSGISNYDYAAAQEFYLANKFTMWKGKGEKISMRETPGKDTMPILVSRPCMAVRMVSGMSIFSSLLSCLLFLHLISGF